MKDRNSINNKIYVWDIVVRIFHWGLVFSVLAAIVLEDFRDLHKFFGYSMLTLISIRVIWGFIGTPYARFSDFVPTPKRLADYLKSLVKHKDKHYVGHNPAGGAMIVLLLIVLFALGISGYMMGMDQFWGEEWVEEIHEFLYLVLLFLVPIHIIGVLVGSLRDKENLIKSMFTGYKNKSNEREK